MRDLLAEAVQCLDGVRSASVSSGRSASQVRQSSSSSRFASLSHTVVQPPRPPSSLTDIHETRQSRPLFRGTLPSLPAVPSRASAVAERNSLFNYTTDRKRKGTRLGSKAAKKKVEPWVHEFMCLAKTDRERTPSAMERATLASAGR